jgi:ribosomal-protein-alanine N-acetyltransferase
MIIPYNKLEFSGGYILPLNVADVHSKYISGLNNPDVNKYLDAVKYSRQTKDDVINFVNSNINSFNSILWGIWQEGHKYHCGTIRLHEINFRHGIATIGVCIFDKDVWGKSIGAKAIFIATQFALDKLKLRWIEAGVYEENISSQKAFLKAKYEWVYDINGKYFLNNKPSIVKFYVSRKTIN